MKRIFAALIRHGRFERPDGVPSAHLPHPLTEEGREDAVGSAVLVLQRARELGAVLDPTIECSPLLRAWESARILAETLRERTGTAFSLLEQPALQERSLGSAANLTMDEVEAAVARDPRRQPLPRDWRRDPHFRLPLPGAESLMEAGSRAAGRIQAAVSAAAARARRDTMLLIVGHGGSLRHAAVHLGVLPVRRAPDLSMEYSDPLVLERRFDGRWSHVAGHWKKRLQDVDSPRGDPGDGSDPPGLAAQPPSFRSGGGTRQGPSRALSRAGGRRLRSPVRSRAWPTPPRAEAPATPIHPSPP